MTHLTQESAPVLEALNRYKSMRVVPFDVPGHKRGKGNRELTEFLGEKCLTVDVNSMKPLDNLCHPVSVIKEAEELAAAAFGARHAFFMVNGTTSAVQSMVMSANKELGISLGMSVSDVEQAILENPDAKAVLVNNPTYYGVCSDLKAITELAHKHNMLVLADEAHGTHFYFGEGLPASAMSVGADMAAVSMHKSGGSLTQSSLLLVNNELSEGYVRQIINLTQTTSGSYLLISSLDISRRNLALRGREIFKKVGEMAEYARAEINQIGGYYAYSRELINGDSVYDFDVTKLSILTLDIGLAGIEVYDILRDEYDIQIEFGDIGNILAYISIGDRILDLERLVSALSEIKRRYAKDRTGMLSQEYIRPQVVLGPQEAFYAESEPTPLDQSLGRICGEFVMCYPPGIPILAPGEKITAEVLEYIKYAKEKGCFLTGTQDSLVNKIQTVKE
ncbi:MAG: aminotransferase class V-fold PLP-dependent enzyme [Sporolactobacillus laevolacticus]|nr:aminotransferase class V-fold PLP-dependent enzyme [Sporolactobacillus laevolacticus]